MTDTTWSQTEQKVAQEAFEKAYKREITALVDKIRQQASTISEIDEVWRLHDFLSAKRHEIDGKYDSREAMLLFTLARLLKEEWLTLDELKGLDADKLAKVAALTRL